MLDFYGDNRLLSEEEKMAQMVNGILSDPTGAVGQLGPQSPQLQGVLAQAQQQAPAMSPAVSPATPPPPQAGGVPQGGLNSFLNSPGYAMANQAANNMYALRRDQVPRQTPANAYQQSANANEVLLMRKAQNQETQRLREQRAAQIAAQESRAKDLHPLAVAAAEGKLDPAYGYKKLVEEELIDPTQVSFLDYSTLSANKALPASIQEWQMYSKLPQKQKNSYLEMKRSSQLIGGAGDTVRILRPGGESELVGDTAQDIASGDANLAATVDAAKQGVEKSGDMFSQFGKVSQSISNIDAAIKAIDDGANTGVIASRFPNLSSAAVELENIRNNMGLDIVGAGSFGALSESELDFALDTALPTNLDGPELRSWLVRKKTAQSKLREELRDAAIYLGQGGNLAELMTMKKAKEQSEDGSVRLK